VAKPVSVAATAGLFIATLLGVSVTGSPAGATTRVHTAPAAAATEGHSSPAAATTQGGCGYGQGGANDGALCWLNMSTYNPFLAQSPLGQRMSLPVGGGYVVSFTVSDQKVGSDSFGEVQARDLSALSGAWLGEKAYRGTPGQPALLQTVSGGTDAVNLSDITVTNAAGKPVTDYNLVVGDAESTDGGESSTYTSNTPLSRFDEPGDAGVCGDGLHGLGSRVVSCSRPDRGDQNDFFLQAEKPRNIRAVFGGQGFSGIAFGLLTAKVSLTDHVTTRRNPSDAFDFGVATAPYTVLFAAGTGTGNSATIGPMNMGDSTYILKEIGAPRSGTKLSKYSITWSCTDNGSSYSQTLPSGSGADAVSVSPQLGDNIACTVTNAVPVVVGPFVTPEAGVGAGAAVAGLLGLGWLLRRRGLGTS
jgi:hypothetical protein